MLPWGGWQTYTPRGRRVFERAIEHARRLHSPKVEPEHVLLGLIQEGEGPAFRSLQGKLGNLAAVQEVLEARIGLTSEGSTSTDAFSEATVQVQTRAWQATDGAEKRQVATDQILIGLLEVPSPASTLLQEYGFTRELIS